MNMIARNDTPSNRANKMTDVKRRNGIYLIIELFPFESMIRPTFCETRIAKNEPGKITSPA